MTKIRLLFRLIKAIIKIHKFNNIKSSYHLQAKSLISEIFDAIDLKEIPGAPFNAKLKIQWYMAEVLYACENFNNLIGLRSAAKQRRSYLLCGALGAMCDLIIDDIDMDLEHIRSLKRPLSNFLPVNKAEELYLACYHMFFGSLEPEVKSRAIYYYELMFDAQIKSKQQFDPNLSKEETDEICKEKGGYSILLLRAIVSKEMSNMETKAWYETGAFVQYCNDAQDLHKDYLKSMQTFATTRSDLQTIVLDIDKQKSLAFSLIKKTIFQIEKKDDLLLSLHVMHMAILSKLKVFHLMTNLNFSKEKFLSFSKAEVRSCLKPLRLFSYWFPWAFAYDYETIENPLEFDFDHPKQNLARPS